MRVATLVSHASSFVPISCQGARITYPPVYSARFPHLRLAFCFLHRHHSINRNEKNKDPDSVNGKLFFQFSYGNLALVILTIGDEVNGIAELRYLKQRKGLINGVEQRRATRGFLFCHLQHSSSHFRTILEAI